jgi:hypothetical protein
VCAWVRQVANQPGPRAAPARTAALQHPNPPANTQRTANAASGLGKDAVAVPPVPRFGSSSTAQGPGEAVRAPGGHVGHVPGGPTQALPPRGPAGGRPPQSGQARDPPLPPAVPRPALAALQRTPRFASGSAGEGSPAGDRRSLGGGPSGESRASPVDAARRQAHDVGFTRASLVGTAQQSLGSRQPASRLSGEVSGDGGTVHHSRYTSSCDGFRCVCPIVVM